MKLKMIIIFTFALFACLFFLTEGNTQTKHFETAGQKFKSIKILNEMPADQMGKVMNMMSASLGVKCGFCHASDDGDYEKEGFEHKDIARQMLKMTFDLNKNYFEGKPEVNCSTCHQGHAHPRAEFPLAPAISQDGRLKQPEKKPDVFELIDKYSAAVGTRTRAGIKTLHIKALRVEPDGVTTEPEEIWAKNEKVLTETRYGDYIVKELFDGTSASKFGNSSKIDIKPDEAEQIKREAQLLSGDLRSIYQKMDFRAVELLDGRKVYRIDAFTSDKQSDRLYFDMDSGLLVRRSSATPTVLGFHVFQVDYLDYKDFSGFKLPTTINYAMPQIYWTRKVVEVKSDAVIDEKKFRR